MQILSGENYEESRVAAHGLRAVPRQEGARDQVDRPADSGGPPQGHPRHPHRRGGQYLHNIYIIYTIYIISTQ